MWKKVSCLFILIAAGMLCGCGTTEAKTESESSVEVTVFAAKSLNTVLDEVIEKYEAAYTGISITAVYDSSGTLMTQITEGAPCDVFFSAAEKQMNTLEEKGRLVAGSRHKVVNNQVCVVTWKGSDTSVTGLLNLKDAQSIALAGGSVPVGKYTRQAMVNAQMLEKADDVAAIPTAEIAAALGDVEINECANVGAVAAAVAEGANEVGTVYYSDTFGYEDRLMILEMIPYELTGNVIYPIAQILNEDVSQETKEAAADFISYVISDEAKEIFEKYYFDTNVE